ncbi:MAG: energy-coupling factor transporter ATPase [Ruminococcaceae bacterium]|nr:energy-coupling factor transporter ATPase [Oscillospiraceae bacterium]
MTKLKLVDVNYTYSEGTPFRKDALRNINIEIEDNCITGLIGHTGCGKSTLVQLLNGLLFPTSGEVIFDGKNIAEKGYDLKTLRHKVGLVFQYPEYQLFEDTVYDDIAFGPKNMGLDKDEIDRRIREAALFVGLEERYFEVSPFDLSGGQKRRAAIAGIMAMDPDVLILDEPAAGLDPIGREEILGGIYSYQRKRKNAVVIVSHSMEDMARYSDKLIVMNGGEVFMQGNCREVFSETDKLLSVGLDVPQITKFMRALKNKGVDVRTDIFTVDEARAEILSKIGGRGNA